VTPKERAVAGGLRIMALSQFSLSADSGFYAPYMIRLCQCEGYCDGSSQPVLLTLTLGLCEGLCDGVSAVALAQCERADSAAIQRGDYYGGDSRTMRLLLC
jgi:hypothetical protein